MFQDLNTAEALSIQSQENWICVGLPARLFRRSKVSESEIENID